jgi:hypothetical protein
MSSDFRNGMVSPRGTAMMDLLSEALLP